MASTAWKAVDVQLIRRSKSKLLKPANDVIFLAILVRQVWKIAKLVRLAINSLTLFLDLVVKFVELVNT